MSVGPSSFFRCEKHSKPRGNRAASASVYLNGQRPAIATAGWHRPIDTATAVCVCGVCARVRAGACARMCVRLFVRHVFAIYDNNI